MPRCCPAPRLCPTISPPFVARQSSDAVRLAEPGRPGLAGSARGWYPPCMRSSTVLASPVLLGGKGLFVPLQRVSREGDHMQAAAPGPEGWTPACCISALKAQPRVFACGGATRVAGAWPTVSTPQHAARGSVFYPRKRGQLPNSTLQSSKGDQLKPGISLGSWCTKPKEQVGGGGR